MVSKANEDFPEPDSPVKTMRRSRGNSSETSLRLCSRAPRMTRREATSVDPLSAAERTGPSRGPLRGSGRRDGVASNRSPKVEQFVSQERSLLESQLGCGSSHLGFDLGDQDVELPGTTGCLGAIATGRVGRR